MASPAPIQLHGLVLEDTDFVTVFRKKLALKNEQVLTFSTSGIDHIFPITM
jgi:hypothetical protein